MVVLHAGSEVIPGNCRTFLVKDGELLQIGDRVELVFPGSAASGHGIVTGVTADAWEVWVSG